jgi:tripartite-type tricarboxylate transporter receptor subunit TctC
MIMHRRKFLLSAAVAIAAPAICTTAWAQNYPARPVRIIVGFPAGGLTDITARLIAQRLSEQLGQQFIVENRPGAVTNLATEAVVRAPADGYTLLLTNSMNAINTTLYDRINYDFIRDVAPVASIVDAAFILEVNPSIPAKTFPEFIAYAKANPGKLSYASSGPGGIEHVITELFMMRTGIKMLHVPYRGSAPAVSDLLGGQVQVYFGPIAPSIEHIKAGKLRALAVTTAKRSQALPDVPAIGELLSGFDASSWQGLGAPRHTPVEVIDKLSKAVNAALTDADLKARFADLGLTVLPGSPVDFEKLIAEDTEKWAKVVRAANIKAE